MGWGSGVAMSCAVGHRHGSDPASLWLWCRPAATALIRSLAWEPPYAAVSVALEKTKRQKKKTKKNKCDNPDKFISQMVVNTVVYLP